MAVYVSVQSKYIHPCQWYSTFTIMQVTHTICNYAPQYQDRCLLLDPSLVKVWLVPFIFGTENSIPFSPKNKLKHGFIWPQQTFPLSSRPSEMSSGPENSPVSPNRTDLKLSPCVTEIQVAFLDTASACVQWKWFSKLLLSTCGCIWQSSVMVSYAMPSEESKVTHIQQRSTALPTQTEISLDSLNLVTNIMYGRWWKAEMLCNLALRNVIF